MRTALNSLSKYPVRSVIYTALLTTSFTTITLLTNTFFTTRNLLKPLADLLDSLTSNEDRLAYVDLYKIRDSIYTSMSSLIPPSLLLILLCVLILPFLQYLFTISRGYEIGILRTLGMGKKQVWHRLFLENIILVIFSLAVTQFIVLTLHKTFSLKLLSINTDMMAKMTEAFADIDKALSYNRYALLFAFGTAITIIIITAGLCSILISSNTPLKLIREYK